MTQDPLLQRMEEDRGWLAQLLSNVPGLGGYLTDSRYRMADRMLRTEQARRLDALQASVDSAVRAAAADVRQSDTLAALQGLQTRLGSLANHVRAADSGFSALDATVKLSQVDLAALLAYDRVMFESLVDIEDKVSNIDASDVSAAAEELDAFERGLNERTAQLRQVVDLAVDEE